MFTWLMNKNDASKSLLQASSHSSCNEEFTFKTFPLILHMLSRRGLNCIFLMKSYFTRSSNQYLLRLKNRDYVNLRGLTNCFPALANSDRTSFNGSTTTHINVSVNLPASDKYESILINSICNLNIGKHSIFFLIIIFIWKQTSSEIVFKV